jgi:hypothetical protein
LKGCALFEIRPTLALAFIFYRPNSRVYLAIDNAAAEVNEQKIAPHELNQAAQNFETSIIPRNDFW